jgi:hypothetical protein
LRNRYYQGPPTDHFEGTRFCRPRLSAAVELDQEGIKNIGEFTGRTFDYHAEHPELVRLLLWESLSSERAVNEVNRTIYYLEKARVVASAQQNGVLRDDIDPAKLGFLLIGLAAWWLSVPQLASMLTGGDDPQERAQRRACVVIAANQLALRHAQNRSMQQARNSGCGLVGLVR